MHTEKRLRARVWIPAALLLVIAGFGVYAFLSENDPSTTDSYDHLGDRGRAEDPRGARLLRHHLKKMGLAIARSARNMVTVSGTVRDETSGEPVAGADVIFVGESASPRARTDDEGRFNARVPMGVYRAYARAEGYATVGLGAFPRHGATLPSLHAARPQTALAARVVALGDRDHVDLNVRASGYVTGRVVDVYGQPVSGATVVAVAGDEPGRSRLVSGKDIVRSGRDGGFTLQAPSGLVHLLAGSDEHSGLTSGSPRTIHLTRGGISEVELTLTEGCTISGVVLDADGQLVEDGQLEISTGRPYPHDFFPSGAFSGGRFRYAQVEEGTVRLRAWPNRHNYSEPAEFDCYDGARYDDVAFLIPPKNPDLTGRLLTESGEPLEGAYLDIYPLFEGGMAQQERSDGAGNWSFHALPAGPYRLSSFVPGEGAAAMEVRVPARDISLELSGVGAIVGEVKGVERGSFILSIESCGLGEGGAGYVPGFNTVARSRRIVQVEGGRFEVDDLPACRIRAVARSRSRSQSFVADVDPDDDAEVVIDLRGKRTKSVWGRVTDLHGRPVERFSVRREALDEPSGFVHTRVAVGREGHYEITVRTGDVLTFSAAEGRASATVSWDEGDAEVLDVVLE